MAQTTILAAGKTAATSTDVAVGAGSNATVGMYAGAGVTIPMNIELVIYADTPGGDQRVGVLNNKSPVVVVSGPGTFRVTRPVITVDVGAFSET